MPKHEKKSTTASNLQHKLATPTQIAEYEQLQAEVKLMVNNIHKPLMDMASFLITQNIIDQLIYLLRAVGYYPVDTLSNFYCNWEILYRRQNIGLRIEAQQEAIVSVLKSGVSFAKWPDQLPQDLGNMIRDALGIHQFCSQPGLITIDRINQAKQLLPKHTKFQALLALFSPEYLIGVCEQNRELRKYIDASILNSKTNPTKINEIAQHIITVLKVHLQNIFVTTETKQICVDVSMYLTILLGSLLSTRAIGAFVLQRAPYGLFYQFLDRKALLLERPTHINQVLLNNYTRQLLQIKNHINTWNILSLWLMRIMLIVSWGILLVSIITKHLSGTGIDLAALIVQPYLMSYALQGSLETMQYLWKEFNIKRHHADTRKLLNQLSAALQLPEWSYEVAAVHAKNHFALQLSAASFIIDNNKIPKKIVLNAIIKALAKNKIKYICYNHSEIVLPASLNLSRQSITRLRADIHTFVDEALNQKALEYQIRQITKLIFHGKEFEYYRIDTQQPNQHGFDYLFNVEFTKYNQQELLAVLQRMYGNDRVIVNDQIASITILAGRACSANRFDEDLSAFKKVVSSKAVVPPAQFSTSADASNASEKADKFVPKDKQESEAPRVSRKNKHTDIPQVKKFDFGAFGSFKSNAANCPQEIDAPFYPRGRHFMLFKAPREAFATDGQFDKFSRIRPHIVFSKGGKGIVSGGGKLFFSAKGDPQKSSLKLKDPTEDLRVYDHVEEGVDSDGNKIHLHVFEHVVEKHKR